MLQGWVIIAVAFAYLGALFAIASYGDRRGRRRVADAGGRPSTRCRSASTMHVLDLLRAVGLASTHGFDFLTIYAGPSCCG